MADQHDGFALGVDLGTSNTVAVLRWPDGRTRPLLVDGQPILPSGVYADPDGRLHVGRDAVRLAQADPVRYEPNPKRRIDEPAVTLGDREYAPAELLAAILRAVAEAAVAATGFLPPAVVTCPATWNADRRRVLADALVRAGWPPAAEHTLSGPIPAGTRLLREPVAAARYYTEVLRRPVPVGAAIAVFDFGGGTLDVPVVRNEGADPWGDSGFRVIAAGGVGDLGGLDLDVALVGRLGERIAGEHPAVWQRLAASETAGQWRDRHQLWENVRGAKEMLSRATVAPVAVPGLEQAARLTRAELEELAAPLLHRAVARTREVVAAAGLTPDQLAGLFLVGGSSRIPLVARLLHAELGVAPTVLEQPELPVAEGALTDLPTRRQAPPAPVPVGAGPAVPASPPRPGGPAGTAPLGPAGTLPDGPAGPAGTRPGGPVGPASPPPGPARPVSGTPMSPGAAGAPPTRSVAYRRWAPWIVLGAVLGLAGVVTATVLYVIRDRHPEREVQSLAEVQRIAAGPERPGDMYTAIADDRAYLAYPLDDDRLAVLAVNAKTGDVRWRTETSTTSDRWRGLVAVPGGLAVFADEFSESRPRDVLLLDASSGDERWRREIRGNDTVYFGDDTMVVVDRTDGQLLGIDLRDGTPRWTRASPRDRNDDADTEVYRVTTDDGNAGAGYPDGSSRQPWLGGSDRLVQVGADRSVRLVDMGTGDILRSRPDVAEPDDLVAAHEDRLYVANGADGYRLLGYDLGTLGEPTVLHLTEGSQGRPGALVACGEHRACLLETRNFDDQTTEVLAVTEGERPTRWPAPKATALVPVGDRLLARWTSTEPGLTLFDAHGKVLRADRDGVAARLDAGNLLVFADPLSTSEGDYSVAWLGGHSGTVRELGELKGVRSGTCSWTSEALVCGARKDFVLYRFVLS